MRLIEPAGAVEAVHPWRIARASVGDAAEAVRILRQAAAWTAESGRGAWSVDDFTIGEHERLARCGELIGGFGGGRMTATMRLQSADPVYWPQDAPGAALYLHKLAVDRAAAGQGWSGRLIGWAWARARERRAPALKLDVLPIPRLIALYASHGFEVVDAGREDFDGKPMVRMQRLR